MVGTFLVFLSYRAFIISTIEQNYEITLSDFTGLYDDHTFLLASKTKSKALEPSTVLAVV